jgi:probable O-glycosylation ligase (exosortase A-associated)
MRDIFLLGILPFLLYPMTQRAFIGLGLWVWTALFFPNGWVYGVASDLRYNLLFTVATVLAYLALKQKPKVRFGSLGALVLLFFLWTTLSSATSIGRPDVVWDIWSRFAKVTLLFVFVVLIVEKKRHVDFMLWCVVLSVGFYANLEALKFLASGGGHKIAGMAGHVLGDRNELAVAFVMTLPVCFYLLGEYGPRSRVVKAGLVATIALLVIAIVGTQSRGGFIALLALAGYLFLKTERKVFVGVLIVALGLVVAHLASSEWLARINTIESADQDASFMGRVVAWKLSFIMAMHHPFFGGGFKSLEYFPVWADLSKEFLSYPWFYTGDAVPNPTAGRAAHSVYFEVLGEHGFVGLAIYLACLVSAFRKAGKAGRAAIAQHAPAWIPSLATTLQLSIFAFALGGAALSFAYFDLTFALFGLVAVLEMRLLPAQQTAEKPAAVAGRGSRSIAEPGASALAKPSYRNGAR